ncbi:MAG: serine hydrolase domain-containing protein [Acidobacteriota bacterium]|nr:serine hydrolase domain-containing protein [Acidobacteriota bacterium]
MPGTVNQAHFDTIDPKKAGMDPDRLSRIDKLIEEDIRKGLIPGAVVMIARKGVLAHHKAFGVLDLSTREPMTRDTIFRVMSNTKVLISVAIMMLQEEGLLNIADPVSHFIPEFKVQEVISNTERMQTRPAETPLTIRHILTHQSGMPYTIVGDNPLKQRYIDQKAGHFNIFGYDETIGEYVRRIAALPRFNHPGVCFEYGWGPDILGRLIEIVSGQSLEEFFRERIYQPLGMVDSHFFLSPEDGRRFPSVYVTQAGGGLSLMESSEQSSFLKGPRKLFSGGAGVVSTTMDWLRLCQMILQTGRWESRRLLSRKSVESMCMNHIGSNYIGPGFRFWGDKFGLGFGIRTERGVHDDLESLGTLSFSGVYAPQFWIDPKEEMILLYFLQVFPHDFNFPRLNAHIKNAAFAAVI